MEMKYLFMTFLFIFLENCIAQTNPGFESGDLTGWSDASTGTESISITNTRTGTYNLSYYTNNSTNQRMENSTTFEIPNNYYLHCIAWVKGSNADAKASIAINISGWSSQGTSTIGTTLTRLSWNRQNSSGSSIIDGKIGLNSRKETNATTLYWDDIIAYVSSSNTTDLISPNSPTSVSTLSNSDGTKITISWTDGTDSETGSQEAIILRTDGKGKVPPTLNDQAQYSVSGGTSGPNTIDSWSVIGKVNVAVQTLDDNTTSPNTDYTYAVYMHDLAFNYSIGTSSEVTALPTELSLFQATIIANKIYLAWQTSTEVNNFGFEVQRSTVSSQLSANSEADSRTTESIRDDSWSKIGFVQGCGNSNSPKDYTFVDEKLAGPGVYFYRLKQIDNDGKFEYSKIVSVNFNRPMEFQLEQNFPNPFNPVTSIRFTLPEGGSVLMKIYDALGREVKTILNEFMPAGVHSINISVGNLCSGIYYYEITAGRHNAIRKMIILK